MAGLTFRDRDGSPKKNFTTTINPHMADYMVQKALEYGYDPHFINAIALTESRMGNHSNTGSNPLRYRWGSEAEERFAWKQHPDFAKIEGERQILSIISPTIADEVYGMKLDDLRRRINVDKALTLLNSKEPILKSKGLPINEENLAWAYNGFGVPNEGAKSYYTGTPDSNYRDRVARFKGYLRSDDSELGQHIRLRMEQLKGGGSAGKVGE